MKAEDHYLKFVSWSEEDGVYVGYCPDLFPWAGVCHGTDEAETYHRLCELVREEVSELQELPPPRTRAMREAIPA